MATRAEGGPVADKARVLEDLVWGPLGFLSRTEAHATRYDDLLVEFADMQLCLMQEGEPIALANCVPARIPPDGSLPDEGWDWLVADGGRGRRDGTSVVGALAISVRPDLRGSGLAVRMLREMKALAASIGAGTLIAPVRPSAKHLVPNAPMVDYVAERDRTGRHRDPWLQAHVSRGGRVAGVCHRSMVVREPLAFWDEWGARPAGDEGVLHVPGALSPILVDPATGLGTYEEPNVWVVADTSS